jgi:putative serine protease PepD
MSGGVLSSNDAIVSIAGGPTTSGVLETDAEAGATAAGAALVDDRGTVVGIVIGRLGRNQTTYAIPIRDAVAVADQLHDDGVAQHGSAGFEGVDTGTGPTVTAVSQGGPAARAGMHVGDVVVAVDGRGVSAMSEVVAIVRAHAPGHTVELEIRRDRGAYKLRVVLDGMGR